MVDVLMAENSMRMDARQRKRLTEAFPITMIERAQKFRRWEDAQAYLFSKYLLVEALQKYGVGNQILEEMKYTAYNRPYLDLPTAIDFNISHAGNYIICAVTDHGKIGVDIEKIHEVDISDFSGQLTEEELLLIKEAPDKYAEFFRIWTIKEAVIKADGRGLSIPLNEIAIGSPTRVEEKIWQIHKLETEPGYIAHIAVDEDHHGEIVLRRVSMPS
jgi:4'-phosphopantetheinyl transferase